MTILDAHARHALALHALAHPAARVVPAWELDAITPLLPLVLKEAPRLLAHFDFENDPLAFFDAENALQENALRSGYSAPQWRDVVLATKATNRRNARVERLTVPRFVIHPALVPLACRAYPPTWPDAPPVTPTVS